MNVQDLAHGHSPVRYCYSHSPVTYLFMYLLYCYKIYVILICARQELSWSTVIVVNKQNATAW